MDKSKILLVDDKKENIVALEHLIASPDIVSYGACNADEALELILKNDFALALLDVQMPGISGFELARLMRSAERSKKIPIIFVTAAQSSQDLTFEGYEHGAVDFMNKPLNAHTVRSKVRVFVELDQKTRALQKKSEALEEKLTEVEALKEASEAANRAKSQFLANMSHEIRTPLGAVLGFAELLHSPVLPADERANCIDTIERNGRHLLKLIDDILDLSKIEAERVEIERTEISLKEFLWDLRAVHMLRASEKGLVFDLQTKGLLPEKFYSDPVRIKQILTNIIGNAIKFTTRGSVILEMSFDLKKDGRHLLCFSVKDSGRGLSSLEIGRLFQPFMQGDSSTKRKFGGTGLGLTISRQLALMLGGNVILKESTPGLGSTFEVTIDPGLVHASHLVPGNQIVTSTLPTSVTMENQNSILNGVRVLVVDDAPDNRLLVRRLLELAGATVETLESGVEALTKAFESPFDVILMDIQMPQMDGHETTQTLRRRGYNKAIVALTAHAMKEEVDRCIASGCDRHLSKPVSKQALIETVSHFAKQQRRLKKSQANEFSL